MDKLKVELKLWEKEFEKVSGRLPEKHDVKSNPDIKRKYKEYAMLKKKQSDKSMSPTKSTPKKNESKLFNDLGPTPQISGKLVSIFEINLSPSKKDDVVQPQVTGSPIKLENAVRRQLNFNFSITPNSSPIKLQSEAQRTVQHSKYGPNSPLKVDELEIRLSSANKEPNLTSTIESSPFGPSPLIKRPSKYLHEFAEEHEIIKDEFNLLSKEFPELGPTRKLMEVLERETQSENADGSDEEGDEEYKDQEQCTRRRPKTIKKKTRSKLRPVLEDKQINFLADNVHEQIAKLKSGEVDIESEERNRKRESTNTASKKPRKSKYNLVSNNFKRLKLPTKNRNNSRWGRRR